MRGFSSARTIQTRAKKVMTVRKPCSQWISINLRLGQSTRLRLPLRMADSHESGELSSRITRTTESSIITQIIIPLLHIGAGGSRDRGIQRSSSLIPLKKHRLFERYSLLSTTLRESYALWAHKLHLLDAFSTLREVDIQNEGKGINANVKGPHLQVTRCARARPLVSNKLQSARAGLHSYSR